MPRKKTRSNNLKSRVNRLEARSRPEVKYRQIQSAAFDAVGGTLGTLLKPQLLPEGVGRNARIGDKVKTRNIRFQAILKLKDSSTTATSAVRILVLRCKMQNASVSDMPSWYGTVDEDKFFVVKDVLTQVSCTAAIAGAYIGSNVKKINFNIPTGLRKMQYDGASLTAPLNNEYVVYMLAENANAETAYNYTHYYIDN